MSKRVFHILGSVSLGAIQRQVIPTVFVGLLLTGLGLTACGQKGPLYLPDPNAPAKAAKPHRSASAAASASSPASGADANTQP